MKSKKNVLPVKVIDLIPPIGWGLATDRITVEGHKIGYMYREEPQAEGDSGWRFFEGTEDEDYLAVADNSGVYNVNTIVNYDPAILPYVLLPIGTMLERISGTNEFKEVVD